MVSFFYYWFFIYFIFCLFWKNSKPIRAPRALRLGNALRFLCSVEPRTQLLILTSTQDAIAMTTALLKHSKFCYLSEIDCCYFFPNNLLVLRPPQQTSVVQLTFNSKVNILLWKLSSNKNSNFYSLTGWLKRKQRSRIKNLKRRAFFSGLRSYRTHGTAPLAQLNMSYAFSSQGFWCSSGAELDLDEGVHSPLKSSNMILLNSLKSSSPSLFRSACRIISSICASVTSSPISLRARASSSEEIKPSPKDLPKDFFLFVPNLSMARAARRVIENLRQLIKSCPVLDCSSHRKTESKTIGNRKRDCAWGGSGWSTLHEKIYRSQSTNQESVCSVQRTDLCFAICRFSQVRFITPSHLTHNLFFYFQ